MLLRIDRQMNPLSGHVAHYGLPFVAANVLLEQLGVPIPAEPTLVIAGGLAEAGLLSPVSLLAATIAAAIIADSSLFFLGRRWQSAVWRIAGRLSRSGGGSEERAKQVFARWGLRVLILARFLPGVSQLLVLMAGATGARFRSFLGYDLIGRRPLGHAPDRRRDAVQRSGRPLPDGRVAHRLVGPAGDRRRGRHSPGVAVGSQKEWFTGGFAWSPTGAIATSGQRRRRCSPQHRREHGG